MDPAAPNPVKLFIGALYTEMDLFEKAAGALQALFGQIDYRSPEFLFAASDYYKTEMGWPIFRRFVSFQQLINPGELAGIKIATNEIEANFAVCGARKVNLDPGYMDFNKVVLASAKFSGQKIYLNDGIYADPTLWFEKGEFEPYAWAFPDFKSGEYNAAFAHIRTLYKNKIRVS